MQTEIFGSSRENSAAQTFPPAASINEEAATKKGATKDVANAGANAGANGIGPASWQMVLSHVASGIVVVDRSGIVIFENEAARSILCGTSLSGINVVWAPLPWPLLNADRKPIQQRELPFVRALVHGESVCAQDIIIPISAADDVVVQVSAALIDVGGARSGVVLTLVDVTQERRAMNRLATLNRSKDEFLAILSHELRTPLTPIMGWVTLMRQVGGGSPEMMAQALASIERNAELLKRLVSDLSDTTRLTSGKLHTEKNPCNLNEIVQVAAQSIAEQAAENGVQIECSFDPNVPMLALDRDRIQQVLMNLLGNAAKFSSSGDTIYLRTRCEHGDEHRGEHQSDALQPEVTESSTRLHAQENVAFPDASESVGANRCVVVEVEDQGAGIALELLPHVFDMFRQGDSSYTRRYGGLGLGLALSKSLVEMHGGTLTAQSGGIEQGALFTVTLPA